MDIREQLLTKLRSLNVTEVNMSYAGYGDSGQLEGVETYPMVLLDDTFDEVELPWNHGEKRSRSIKQALEDFAWDLITSHYGGFENNEGGQGEIAWDVTADTITLDHGWNVIEVDHAPTVTL